MSPTLALLDRTSSVNDGCSTKIRTNRKIHDLLTLNQCWHEMYRSVICLKLCNATPMSRIFLVQYEKFQSLLDLWMQDRRLQ